jgi:hypothetical protein
MRYIRAHEWLEYYAVTLPPPLPPFEVGSAVVSFGGGMMVGDAATINVSNSFVELFAGV